MAEEILGISGQMDISDIQKSFDTLFGNLDELGVKTDSLSARMTKALNDIAQSSDVSNKSTQQAFKELNAIISEAQEKLTTTPKKIQDVSLELSNAAKTVETLKDRLSQATVGTTEWNTVTQMLENQNKTVERLKAQYSALTNTFSDAQTAANVLGTTMGTVNTVSSLSNAATGVNAGLHVGVAAAVGAESVAHAANAEKIGVETQAVNDNTQAFQEANETSRQRTETANAEAIALDKLSEQVLQGKASEEEYIKAKESAEERYRQLMNEQAELLEKEKKAREEANTFKVVDGNIVSGDNDMNARAADALLERAANIRKEADEIANSLNRLSEAYTSTTQTAQAEQKKEEESTNKTLDAIRAKEDELKKLNEQVELMKAHHANGWGGDFFTSMRKGENPLNVIKDYFAEGSAIKEKQQQIADITAELEKLRTAADETKTSTTDIWSGMSKNDITNSIQENIAQLKILKSEYSEIAQVYGKDSDKAQANKEKQEEITREIIQSKEKLREMGTSYEDATKEAKKTAKETQGIGKEAEKSSSKVKGIFGGLKSSFSGLMKGDFSGLFKFVGKIGVWGAGIAAVGKGLFELSKAAEAFRVALQPLDHYMDTDKIKDVRQNILALTATTTKSCADMANAALQFVKVWDGLKDAPGALTQMIKSANEYGALTGKTSEEGAKAISKMASEYHMTAQEASEMSNIIASASKHSVSSFGEMSDAIASAGSTASLYGIGFKEMATLIGYSSGQFGDANKAASKFSMLLMSMSKLQDKYNPSVVGMVTALKNLKDAYERGENVASKFIARNRSVAMYFIKNADAIEQYGKKLEDAHAKNELLSDLSSRASVNLAALKNEWNGFLTGLNANLTPVLTNILKFFRTITGGAQEAADVLHYLKVMDNEKGRSKASIGPVGTGGFNANLAGSTIAEGADVDLYKKQRDALQKIYSKAVAAARNKYKPNSKTGYKGISAEGMFNAGMNAVKNAIENSPQNYSQFKKSRIYNYFYKENKKNTLALNQKPNNTNTDLGGGFGGDDKGEEARKYREQLAEQQAKEEARKRKERWDLYVAEEEKGIAKEKDVAEKERRQRALDFEKKMHQLDEEAEQLKQKNIDTAKANYEKDPANKKKEGFYALGLDKKVGLTSEQQKYIQTKKDTLLVENAESERKYLREQLQYYYDYLKEFGSIQEQKYAIAKEYDEKIAKATSPNQRKLLEEQKKSSLANVELEAVKQNIDWGSVFGDFGTMFKDQLEPTIKSLKQLASKTENVDEKKTIWELVSKLQKTGTLWDSDIFVTISNDLKTYQEAMRSYAEAQKKEQKVADELTEAEERLKNAQKSGNEKDILDASATVDKLKNQMSEAADATKGNKDAVVKATTDLQTSSQRAVNQFQQLESCLSGLTSGTLKGIGDALMGLDKLFGGKATDKAASSLVKMTTELFGSNSKLSKTLTKVLGESGMTGEIVSAALGILDILKDGVENLVSSLIDTILGAVNGLIKTALSPKTVTGILKSVFDGVTSIFDTLSFGTISNIFGDNSAKMESKIDKLNTSNEALKMSIDNLRDKIEKSNSLSEILNAQNKKEKQTKELEQNTSKQMIYETWKHGAWRSNLAASVEDNKGWKDAMKQVSAILGKKVKTSGDFLSLSAEEMQRIIDSDNGAELWAKILNEYNKEGGKGGRSDKLSDMLNQYVNDFGNVAQDMADEIKEKLNGISFDSMKDSFISALMDMDKNAEDFASDFSKIMQQALLNLSVDELINGSENNPNGDSLKKLYDDMAEAMKNETYKSRAEEFAQRQQKLLEQGMKMRDELAQFTGYGEQSSQSATGKAIETITADQASTLIGIGYALQSAVEQGNATRENIHSNVEVICSYQMLMSDNISEIRDMQYQGLNQLQQIAKNTEPITGINENIANMYKLIKERI
ncbi:phage tail tape measure protein [Leyella stercorea]|uniref:phage tail tape measure protein n=1 Tax=Leyella stercorea TaxID=363265 RepID=UPI00266C0596|nr:phage tail tape measure protein [Leyella stercorea]